MFRQQNRLYGMLFLIAFVVLLPAIFWGKIHDDEVIYWEIARNIAKGLGPLSSVDPSHPKFFVWHVPFPSYLVAPLAGAWTDIVPVRIFTAVVSALGAVAIFRVTERLANRTAAWCSFLLILTSFHWLRYGGRFYYDAFGFALFWWAADCHIRRRGYLTGILLVCAVLARELWLLPALILGVLELFRPSRWRAIGGAMVPMVLFAIWVLSFAGAGEFLRETAVISGGKIVAGNVSASPLARVVDWMKGWAGLAAAHGIGGLGAVASAVIADRRLPARFWVIAGASALTVSVTPGFLVNGGFTQYGLLMTGFVAVAGAVGWLAVVERFTRAGLRRHSPVLSLGCLLGIQLVAGNTLVHAAARYGSETVYGLGMGPDREIIALLRREAPGQTVAGIHGAFAPDVTRWFWIERHVDRLSQIQPDWIVVYRQWVNVSDDPGLTLHQIGPYAVIHVNDPAALDRALAPGTFPRPGL